MVILAVMAVLVLGGGASVVAENAVPGDILYPIKVTVNEEVRGMLAIGAEADAQWEIELAERRLEEAKELEAKGELTADVEADLSAKFSSHAKAALEAAATMQAEGKGEAAQGLSVALEAVTSAHAALFARDSASGQASGKRVFVLPHVLEKSGIIAPRDSASGQATGRLQVGDMDKDGMVDVVLGADGSAAMDGSSKESAKASMDPDSDDDGVSDAEMSADAKVEMKAGYDLGVQKKI